MSKHRTTSLNDFEKSYIRANKNPFIDLNDY